MFRVKKVPVAFTEYVLQIYEKSTVRLASVGLASVGLASVGLAQARPNKIIATCFPMYVY